MTTRYDPLSAFPGYTFTRTGEQGAVDASGAVQFFAANVPAINSAGYHAYGALTNLLLNAGSSSVLSTQSVTVTAVAHTLAFIGTGTITLTGTSTAGPLVGTGANNQVSLTFTPTAGSLTLTVSGDVRFAGLMVGTLAAPVPIIATAGATASIGASDLRVTDSIAAGDQLIWSTASLSSLAGGPAARRLMYFSDAAADAEVITFYVAANGTLEVQVYTGAANQPYVTLANTATDFTIGLRRSGGNWRAFAVRDGVLTWFAADSLGNIPAITRLNIGQYRIREHPLEGRLKGIFRKAGTFDTDAKVLAAVAETA